jgi:uncharacterized damage-inducible protein DinB
MSMSDARAKLKQTVFFDLERELRVTRAVLAAIPESKFDWKAHPKSMSLGQLALHVANLVDWMRLTLDRDALDISDSPNGQVKITTNAELLARFDGNATALRAIVDTFDISQYYNNWTLQRGGQTITTQSREKVWRLFSVNHLIHHRGQLCVYLRLLDVTVPTVYFNTADNRTMTFD